MAKKKEDRSISIGNNSVIGSIQTGEQNFAVVNQEIQFPSPDSVDLKKQLELLRNCVERLDLTDKNAAASDINELQIQIKESEPDKEKMGNALTRIAGYVKKSSIDLATKESLKACFIQFAAWLGSNWHNLVLLLPH